MRFSGFPSFLLLALSRTGATLLAVGSLLFAGSPACLATEPSRSPARTAMRPGRPYPPLRELLLLQLSPPGFPYHRDPREAVPGKPPARQPAPLLVLLTSQACPAIGCSHPSQHNSPASMRASHQSAEPALLTLLSPVHLVFPIWSSDHFLLHQSPARYTPFLRLHPFFLLP